MSRIALGMALIDAVKSGDRDAVADLLDAGADPDAVDLLDGLPALHYAGPAVAGLLRDRGASPLPDAPPLPAEPAARGEDLAWLAAALSGPGADLAACLGP